MPVVAGRLVSNPFNATDDWLVPTFNDWQLLFQDRAAHNCSRSRLVIFRRSLNYERKVFPSVG